MDENNIVLFFIGIAIYLYFSYNKISLVYLPLFIIVLIYVIKITKKVNIKLFI